MGSFAAHELTGLYSIFLGLWWMYNATLRYIASRKLNVPYHASSWYTVTRFPNFPIEPLIPFIGGIAEVIGEFATGWDENGFTWTNGHHVVMFSMVSLYGLSQLLAFYRIWIIPGVDYTLCLFTLFISGFLLTHHTHGHGKLDILIHAFVLYPTAGFFFTTMLQFFRSDLPIVAMVRAMFAVHFGLNWLHAGLILFPPWGASWDPESHKSSTQVTVLFGAELVISAMLILILPCFVKKLYGNDVMFLKKIAQLQSHEMTDEKTEHDNRNGYCE